MKDAYIFSKEDFLKVFAEVEMLRYDLLRIENSASSRFQLNPMKDKSSVNKKDIFFQENTNNNSALICMYDLAP